ncbi:MAG: hypothetical protein Q4G35_09940 [Propionibacteriaceae bacterium]|nr:hypothetical protein [Propionibacteriaceae bacterium]
MFPVAPVPRYPLGEYAYQGLWWGIVILPGVVAILRALTAPPDMTFFLFAVIGLPAIIAGQVIAGLLAWTYRRQQWRHFLGPIAAKLSFAYYGAWVLLALALPESGPITKAPSLLMRMFGKGFADGLSGLLFWVIPLLFVALLAAIVVEGRQAVRRWA